MKLRQIIDTKNKTLRTNLKLVRGPFGLSLIFSKMIKKYCDKYTLAEQDINGESFNHLFVFQHVAHNPALIEQFLKHAAEPGSFEGEAPPVARTAVGGKIGAAKRYRLGPGSC